MSQIIARGILEKIALLDCLVENSYRNTREKKKELFSVNRPYFQHVIVAQSQSLQNTSVRDELILRAKRSVENNRSNVPDEAGMLSSPRIVC